MSQDPPKKGLGVPVEVARQQLMEDEDTQAIAALFGVPVEQYVALVLDYAQNPGKEPVLEVIEDEEELEALGLPSQGEVQQWLGDVEAGRVDLAPQPVFNDNISSSFDQEKRKAAAGIGSDFKAPKVGEVKREVVVGDNPMGAVLKDQLLNQRTKSHISGTSPKINKKPKPPGTR